MVQKTFCTILETYFLAPVDGFHNISLPKVLFVTRIRSLVSLLKCGVFYYY